VIAEARRRAPAAGRRDPARAAGAAPRTVWFLDLDDTLHDASYAIGGQIDARMTRFVARHLDLDEDEASRLRVAYWKRYGATLLGLLRHHDVDPHRFLRETHDFDVGALLRAQRGLARRLARLPGRKVLMTNAPRDYAMRVLQGIGLRRTVRDGYTIESLRAFGGFRPKPSTSMLRMVMAREGLAGRARRSAAILVEDNLENLRAARAVGLRTVLVQRAGVAAASVAARRRGPRRLAGGAYVDVRVHSAAHLLRIADRLAGRR